MAWPALSMPAVKKTPNSPASAASGSGAPIASRRRSRCAATLPSSGPGGPRAFTCAAPGVAVCHGMRGGRAREARWAHGVRGCHTGPTRLPVTPCASPVGALPLPRRAGSRLARRRPKGVRCLARSPCGSAAHSSDATHEAAQRVPPGAAGHGGARASRRSAAMWPRKRLNKQRPERTSGRCSSRPRAGLSARLCSSPMAARRAMRPAQAGRRAHARRRRTRLRLSASHEQSREQAFSITGVCEHITSSHASNASTTTAAVSLKKF